MPMPEATHKGRSVGIRIDVPVGVYCPFGDRLGTLQLFCSPHSTTALFFDLPRPITYTLKLEHDSEQPVSVKRSECGEDIQAELFHPRGGRARATLVVYDEWGNQLVTAQAGHR